MNINITVSRNNICPGYIFITESDWHTFVMLLRDHSNVVISTKQEAGR